VASYNYHKFNNYLFIDGIVLSPDNRQETPKLQGISWINTVLGSVNSHCY